MNETANLKKEIRRISLSLSVAAALVSSVIFKDSFSSIGVGILIGTLSGLIGFNMIVRMSESIELYEDASKAGYAGYLRRYFIYALIFGLSAWRGVNVIALLAGMLCHKASILLYVFLHRKEDD